MDNDTLKKMGWSDAALKAIDNYFKYIDSLPEEEAIECMDNVRMARAGNAEEVKAYIEIAKSGCCGSCDKMIWVDDEIILIGYNFGH